ncbi:MAG: hypothetical protein JWO93_2032 [Micrococcaceae bacterium]|nr:hypothetical protein [Micrococcaceae bacterium]
MLFCVALFWAVGSLGGLAFLHDARSPLVTLAWLYFMLFLIVCSVVAGAFAAADLARQLRLVRAAARTSTPVVKPEDSSVSPGRDAPAGSAPSAGSDAADSLGSASGAGPTKAGRGPLDPHTGTVSAVRKSKQAA